MKKAKWFSSSISHTSECGYVACLLKIIPAAGKFRPPFRSSPNDGVVGGLFPPFSSKIRMPAPRILENISHLPWFRLKHPRHRAPFDVSELVASNWMLAWTKVYCGCHGRFVNENAMYSEQGNGKHSITSQSWDIKIWLSDLHSQSGLLRIPMHH